MLCHPRLMKGSDFREKSLYNELNLIGKIFIVTGVVIMLLRYCNGDKPNRHGDGVRSNSLGTW